MTHPWAQPSPPPRAAARRRRTPLPSSSQTQRQQKHTRAVQNCTIAPLGREISDRPVRDGWDRGAAPGHSGAAGRRRQSERRGFALIGGSALHGIADVCDSSAGACVLSFRRGVAPQRPCAGCAQAWRQGRHRERRARVGAAFSVRRAGRLLNAKHAGTTETISTLSGSRCTTHQKIASSTTSWLRRLRCGARGSS